MAGEQVEVEYTPGLFNVFCSELGAYRIFHKYLHNDNARVEFCKARNSWRFSLDAPALT